MRYTGLVIFDLDGTLLREETCCEVLARHLGYEERMAEMEKLRELEKIERAREEMLGWYAGSSVDALREMLGAARLAPGAEEGVALLRERGFLVGIASITWSFAVEHFAARLGVDWWLGTPVDSRGRIHHIWPDDKPRWIRRLAVGKRIDPVTISAVGDSFGDVPMLLSVAHPYFVGAALPPELASAEHHPDGDILDIANHIINTPARRDLLVSPLPLPS